MTLETLVYNDKLKSLNYWFTEAQNGTLEPLQSSYKKDRQIEREKERGRESVREAERGR